MSEHSLNDALRWIKTILDDARNPCHPGTVPHSYDDKYHLAEFLTNAALNARLICLDLLGWNDAARMLAQEWIATTPHQRRAVLLRFESDQRCELLRHAERLQEAAVKGLSKQVASFFQSLEPRTTRDLDHQVAIKIIQYVYEVRVHYRLSVEFGIADRDLAETTVVLAEAERTAETVSNVRDSPPIPFVTINDPVDLDISFIMKNLTADPSAPFNFKIDRLRADCATPRRNAEIDEDVAYFLRANQWAGQLHHILLSRWKEQLIADQIDMDVITSRGRFIPVVLLLEKRPGTDSVLLSPADLARFLQEQKRSLAERFAVVENSMPNGRLITVVEGKLLVVLQHKMSLARTYVKSMDEIEDMLQAQLIAASVDTSRPVTSRNLREGRIKIYSKKTKDMAGADDRPQTTPPTDGDLIIDTHVRNLTTLESTVMYIPINLSTKVSFLGKRTMHACLFHQFSDSGTLTLSLKARARQFSSFILVAGRISTSSDFAPLAAIIMKNKNDLQVPLSLEQIATSQEFDSAVESLSPEQQGFAKAFRGLQLQGTLFAVCVVDIKPQMELLLNLPPDSLTKEIKLAQDLEHLFVQYQIPSDLLRFDVAACHDADRDAATDAARINAVKRYTAHIYSIIKAAETKEMEAKARAQHQVREEKDGFSRDAPALRETPIIGPISFAALSGALLNYSLGPSSVLEPPVHSNSTTGTGGKTTSITAHDSSLVAPMATSVLKIPNLQASLSADMSITSTSACLGSSHSPLRMTKGNGTTSSDPHHDFVVLPKALTNALGTMPHAAVRPAILCIQDRWTRSRAKSILHPPTTTTLDISAQRAERDAAFHLLDALSRSGELTLENVHLHVICAATHAFDRTLVDTVIRGNVDPLSVIRETNLVIAGAVAGVSAGEQGVLTRAQSTSGSMNFASAFA
ncbi:hypothetical protein HDU87_001493 [Geranomyces variabilis]|uniref:Uncharacterized protein n=1 Tax=Geranomyces variabilis TaxID=109894 RepID=A0AAD5TB38_9FUNG|nr:hypothetical protein HDU87_001493 [Geranomyces variabilis]